MREKGKGVDLQRERAREEVEEASQREMVNKDS